MDSSSGSPDHSTTNIANSSASAAGGLQPAIVSETSTKQCTRRLLDVTIITLNIYERRQITRRKEEGRKKVDSTLTMSGPGWCPKKCQGLSTRGRATTTSQLPVPMITGVILRCESGRADRCFARDLEGLSATLRVRAPALIGAARVWAYI